MALGREELRARIAQLYKDWYGVRVAPERVVVTTGSSAAFVLAFLALFDARRCRRAAVARLSLLPPHPLGAGAEAGSHRDRARDGLDADGGRRRRRREPRSHQRPPDRKPRQSDRHHDYARASRGARAACRRAHVRLISDEIYHGLTYGRSARERAAAQRRGDRRQQLLEVLLDDGVAHRLDGGAARARARGRAARAEPLHLRPGDRAGGRARGVRWHGRARGKPPRLRREPRAAAGGAAARRASRRSPRPTAPSTSIATSAT